MEEVRQIAPAVEDSIDVHVQSSNPVNNPVGFEVNLSVSRHADTTELGRKMPPVQEGVQGVASRLKTSKERDGTRESVMSRNVDPNFVDVIFGVLEDVDPTLHFLAPRFTA
jgi:hypothetical protein